MREDTLVSFFTFSDVEELARRRVPIVARRTFITSILHIVETDWSPDFA